MTTGAYDFAEQSLKPVLRSHISAVIPSGGSGFSLLSDTEYIHSSGASILHAMCFPLEANLGWRRLSKLINSKSGSFFIHSNFASTSMLVGLEFNRRFGFRRHGRGFAPLGCPPCSLCHISQTLCTGSARSFSGARVSL